MAHQPHRNAPALGSRRACATPRLPHPWPTSCSSPATSALARRAACGATSSSTRSPRPASRWKSARCSTTTTSGRVTARPACRSATSPPPTRGASGDVLTHRDAAVLWLEYELLPWLPYAFERALLSGDRPLVVDYDDAIFHRYDHHGSGIVRALLGRKIDRLMRQGECRRRGQRLPRGPGARGRCAARRGAAVGDRPRPLPAEGRDGSPLRLPRRLDRLAVHHAVPALARAGVPGPARRAGLGRRQHRRHAVAPAGHRRREPAVGRGHRGPRHAELRRRRDAAPRRALGARQVRLQADPVHGLRVAGGRLPRGSERRRSSSTALPASTPRRRRSGRRRCARSPAIRSSGRAWAPQASRAYAATTVWKPSRRGSWRSSGMCWGGRTTAGSRRAPLRDEPAFRPHQGRVLERHRRCAAAGRGAARRLLRRPALRRRRLRALLARAVDARGGRKPSRRDDDHGGEQVRARILGRRRAPPRRRLLRESRSSHWRSQRSPAARSTSPRQRWRESSPSSRRSTA